MEVIEILRRKINAGKPEDRRYKPLDVDPGPIEENLVIRESGAQRIFRKKKAVKLHVKF